ncbi:MAG: MMCAP2_0565 family pilin-like conjugal transfer protein [Patescibacteria group bacterium]
MSHAKYYLSRAALVGLMVIAGLGAWGLSAHAQIDISTDLGTVAGPTGAGFGTTTLPQLIGTLISAVLGFLGIILLVIILYAGFLWMTAGGNDEQVKKAKKWMINGIIGLVITLGAYAVSQFVITALQTAGLTT